MCKGPDMGGMAILLLIFSSILLTFVITDVFKELPKLISVLSWIILPQKLRELYVR
jgi:hypothetical protein